MSGADGKTLFPDGGFSIGANYWASNAGADMWKEFDENVIRTDFLRLKKTGVGLLRVFPLWSDFQPIRMLKTGGNRDCEIRIGEEPLPFTPEGRAGVDPEMADRFRRFLAIAEENGMRLIVGLLTGWMSGRMYAPDALSDCALLSDPKALRWETSFIRYMVSRFRSSPAIVAWDLGNECNVMARSETRDGAYAWTALISGTIRAADDTRPILSGMHSLTPDGVWSIPDQGELTDVLTTHPYPLFTPHCDTDPINRMKSAFHAAAEGAFYAGLGGKPCICEEIGTLGPMFASETVAADYVRAVLFTLLSRGGRAFLWWCANDQSHLTRAPYDWCAVERELGLLRRDGSAKPVADVLRDFGEFLAREALLPLPRAESDAVIVSTQSPDPWAVAYGAYLLAAQAHMTVSFVGHGDPLPDSRIYMLPSLSGDKSLSRGELYAVLDRVRAGATAYLSIDDGLLSPFESFTGLRIVTRHRSTFPIRTMVGGKTVELQTEFSYAVESAGAEILARTEDGHPLFARMALGQGQVYTLLCPIERIAATVPGILDGEGAQPLCEFYRALPKRPDRVVEPSLPTIGVTEHREENGDVRAVLVNYEPEPAQVTFSLASGYRAVSCVGISGAIPFDPIPGGMRLTLPHNDGCVVRLVRE